MYKVHTTKQTNIEFNYKGYNIGLNIGYNMLYWKEMYEIQIVTKNLHEIMKIIKKSTLKSIAISSKWEIANSI